MKSAENISRLATGLLSFVVTLVAALFVADHWRAILERLWFW